MNIMKACLMTMEREARLEMPSATKGRLASRRLVWHDDKLRLIRIKNSELLSNRRAYILTWIDQHTTGNFYFGGNIIGFEEEKDEMMFKLGFKVD